MTITEFMQKYGITLVSCEKIDTRPDGITWGSNHWRLVYGIAETERLLEIYYSGGKLVTEVDSASVFYCYLDDANDGHYDPFDFILELGYTDIEQARISYGACRKARKALREFLGRELFDIAMRRVHDGE